MNTVVSGESLPPILRKIFQGGPRRIKRAWSIITTGIDPLANANQLFLRSASASEMPQADMRDQLAIQSEEKDWRTYFASKLNGRGLEIGPLHRPLVTHPGMLMEYVDRYTSEQLRKHYPELDGQHIVEPNIISDAETLNGVADKSYDFLVSAHVIEHMKNPIGSLEQWCRVVKPGGYIYLIIPDKRKTFDIKRVRTTLEHIILDSQAPSAERDFEHCLEYASLVHNMTELEAVKKARQLLEANYSIHYHVFIPDDITMLLNWFSKNVRPIEIVEGPAMSPTDMEFNFLIKVI